MAKRKRKRKIPKVKPPIPSKIKPAFVATKEFLDFLKESSDLDDWDKAMIRMLKANIRLDRKRKQNYIV